MKTLLEGLLLPPLFPILMCMIWSWIQWVRNKRGVVLPLLSLITLICAMPFVSQNLLNSLDSHITPSSSRDLPEAIIVLGGDITHAGNSAVARIVPGPLSTRRMATAAALYRQTGLPLLVTAGSELAPAMTDQFKSSFGIEPKWTDITADDTWGNAIDSMKTLQQAHIHSVYLVTDGWHMARAEIAFQAVGLDITPYPVLIDRNRGFDASDLIPRPECLLSTYYAFHEWIGLLWYDLRSYISHNRS
jgi:uncharacterized SAM-binding protein YcdF (DUF218 family)